MSEYFNDEFPQGQGKRRPKREKKHKKYSQKKTGLIIVGDSCIGKTTYIDALLGDEFYSAYDPTTETENHIHEFITDKGGLEGVFRIYDINGKDPEKVIWPTRSKIKCAILMFDLTSINTYRNIENWFEKINSNYPGIFIVLCGNKADARERVVRPKFIRIHKKYNIPYYDISAKNMVNVDKPLMFFVNRLKERKQIEKEMKISKK